MKIMKHMTLMFVYVRNPDKYQTINIAKRLRISVPQVAELKGQRPSAIVCGKQTKNKEV
jgi:hypothetical protein